LKPSLAAIRRRVQSLADPAAAIHAQRFFKTAPGEYGAGDQFLGIRVPVLRKLVREFRGLTLPEVALLLRSKWHEERLLALFFLTDAYAGGDAATRERIYLLYLENCCRVNNWDLVDSSAHLIVGPWLEQRDRAVLREWARSGSLWERRIAVVATFHFIRRGDFADILHLAELLLEDPHDLMHKAVGWMLREVGKRDRATLEKFLASHAGKMPRTMLRYAIEKFPETERQRYLRAGKA
jgi:3-methyladenine DNA glycosylase AlkD